MLGPVEELHAVLEELVEDKERFALVLTTSDDELPLVVQVLKQMDESSQDVYLVDVSAVTSLAGYVHTVMENIRVQLEEVNQERARLGREPLPAFAADPNVEPGVRLRCLVEHVASWVAEDQRMVIALLPSHISSAYAEVVRALAPLHERGLKDLRLIVRDDRAEPMAEQTELGSVCSYTTRMTISELADATAADAANKDLSVPRRINALLQCAVFDTALGRYEAAIDKYGILFQYYDEHEEMQAMVLQGLGDILGRLKRYPAARDKYLQSLDLASNARSMQLILSGAMLLGEVDMTLHSYDEAEKAFELGAETAEKLANEHVRADLLEKCGVAREAQENLTGAAECWSQAMGIARETGYDARLASVLGRLLKVSRKERYDDGLRATYDSELQTVRARLQRS